MKPITHISALFGRRSLFTITAIACLLGCSAMAFAQAPPPIGGVTGTIALEGTVDAIDVDAHTVIVKTIDGARHLFHATEDLLVHVKGGTGALKDLRVGTAVVVHHTAASGDLVAQEIDQVGAEGLRTTEGIVTGVDRGRKEITIRLQGGGVETLQLTERAALSSGKELDRALTEASKVTVY